MRAHTRAAANLPVRRCVGYLSDKKTRKIRPIEKQANCKSRRIAGGVSQKSPFHVMELRALSGSKSDPIDFRTINEALHVEC
jgi:hypothetical protein